MFEAVSSEKSIPTAMRYLLTYIDFRLNSTVYLTIVCWILIGH